MKARIFVLDSPPWNSVRFTVQVGGSVRIKKGALGSYRMARISNGTSGWVQVRRVE